MKRIVIGKSGLRTASIDLKKLLRTRLLIQAGSGYGKSWLLRRLAEQLFGVVQVLIVDPEGEFATLREKFGFVLVGPGGETPADPRSAALVAHRLLELRASAICDLSEMIPAQRHAFVRAFLDALINAPKKLRVLHAEYPKSISREALAEAVGVSHETGSFSNNLSGLRMATMLVDERDGAVKCSAWMFID